MDKTTLFAFLLVISLTFAVNDAYAESTITLTFDKTETSLNTPVTVTCDYSGDDDFDSIELWKHVRDIISPSQSKPIPVWLWIMELQNHTPIEFIVDTLGTTKYKCGISVGFFTILDSDSISLIVTEPTVTKPISPKKNGGGSGCFGDCESPTGYKSTSGQEIVKNGFIYNNNATDLTGYHTPYPKITVTTNATNNLTVKAYDNSGVHNIKWLQVGFGMPEIGSPLNDAQSMVTIYLKHGEIEKIIPTEDYPLVELGEISVEIVDCGYINTECLQISLDHIFRDQPKYDIVYVQWADNYGYSKTYYVNDGIEVIGESLNEPLELKVEVSKGGTHYPQRAGTVELKLSDYKTDIWQDEYDYLWSMNQYGPYITDVISPPVKSDKTGEINRNHSEFSKIKEFEIERALEIFDASLLETQK